MKLGVGGMADLVHRHIFTVERAGYAITADANLMNKDLVVNLTGGELPHLGGIVGFDRQTGKVTKTYFASHDGRKHKDILLAERFVKRAADRVPGNLCVTAGVHIDNITADQINASFPMTDELAEQVVTWLTGFARQFRDPRYTTHLKNFKPEEGRI